MPRSPFLETTEATVDVPQSSLLSLLPPGRIPDLRCNEVSAAHALLGSRLRGNDGIAVRRSASETFAGLTEVPPAPLWVPAFAGTTELPPAPHTLWVPAFAGTT